MSDNSPEARLNPEPREESTAAQRNQNAIESSQNLLVVVGDRQMVELFSGLALDRNIPTQEYDYTDTPLINKRDIRLLELLPGGDIDDLSCDVFTINLSEADSGSYEAVSYMWKDETEHMNQPESIALRTNTIFCQNGTHLKISKNLNNLLRRLRHPDYSRALWIDQICINQEDADEQLVQIPLMQDIYEGAAQVLFWIGEEDEHTKTAFALVNKIFEVTCNKPLGDHAHPQAILHPHLTAAYGLPTFPGPEWESLSLLFKRQVYRRAWIIQELTLNRMTKVHCGSQDFSFAVLAYTARFLVDSSWARLLVHQYGSEVRPIFLATLYNFWLRIHATHEEQSLALLIASTRRFASTFPQDKIYALIGLARRGQKSLADAYDETPEVLLPSKDKSAAQTFQDVTFYIIRAFNTLEMLSTKQDPSLTKTPDLPSWVPDYVVWPEVTILGMPNGIPYAAAGESSVDARLSATGATKLVIKASCVDSIACLGREWTSGTAWPDQLREWYAFIQENASVDDEYLWRALIGNFVNGAHQYPAPSSFKTHYDAAVLSTCFEHDARESTADGDAALFANSFQFIGYLRRIFISAKGRVGLAPRSAREGDEILLMAGGRVPFVVRRRRDVRLDDGDGDGYEVIAECYLQGLMDGEAVQEDGFSWREVSII